MKNVNMEETWNYLKNGLAEQEKNVIQNLTSSNLKRVCHFDTRMITLDEDGVFDLWIQDVFGTLLFENQTYTNMYSINPSELFQLLSNNAVKKDL